MHAFTQEGHLILSEDPLRRLQEPRKKHTIRGIFTYIWLVFTVNVGKDNYLLLDWTVWVMVGKKWKQSFQCNTNSGKLPQLTAVKNAKFQQEKCPVSFKRSMPRLFSRNQTKPVFWAPIVWSFGMMPPVNIALWDYANGRNSDSKVALSRRVFQIHGRFFMIEQWWSWCSPKQLFTPSCIEMSTRFSNPKWLSSGWGPQIAVGTLVKIHLGLSLYFSWRQKRA